MGLNDRIAEIRQQGISPEANADIHQVQAFFVLVILGTVDESTFHHPTFWHFQARRMALEGGYMGGKI